MTTTKKEQLLNVLKNGELVETNIAFETGLNKKYANKYLNQLKEEGKVLDREEVGTTGKVTRYWRLK